VEKLGAYELRPYIAELRLGWKTGARPLSFSVFEEFDLAQALFRFGFALVRSTEALALFRKYLVAFFDFFDHFAPPILF
jgi:hypothetical protein